MKQSPLQGAGLHVAMIMDGNGRWAAARGLPRSAGHRVGARAVRGIVEAAPQLGVKTLTLYAFSADNWQRPTREVTSLMRLLRVYLHLEVETCLANGVRLTIIGQRDELAPSLREAIDAAEAATAHGSLLNLRLAINYSARRAIARAAGRLHSANIADPTLETFAHVLGEVDHGCGAAPDVDLLIRTGGEQRLSDFLLWECAYAELYFSPKMWPDFKASDLEAALGEFARRERRFGRVPTAVAQ
jgi:undecaprenyl diphosphate synthase